MPPKSRTRILFALVAVLGTGLAGYYYVRFSAPTTMTAKPVAAKKPSSKQVAISHKPKETTTSKEENTEGAQAATATKSAPNDEVPPVLDIPSLINRVAGKITGEQDPRVKGGFRGEIFVRLDENGDLKLEETELPEHYRVAMQASDKDGDGMVNFDEFDAAIAGLPDPSPMKTTVPASALLNPPEPGKEIPVYEPALPRKGSEAPLWFTNLDRSKDGHIAVYEWPTGRLNEFRALDANDDGFITLEEAKKAEALKEASRQQTTEPVPTTGRAPQAPIR